MQQWLLQIVAVALLLSHGRSACHAAPLPKGAGLEDVIGEPAELTLQLADLGRFEDQHNDRLGWHSRNIMAVAPEGMEEFDALERGSWSELPTGGHVWRVRIVSRGASSHTLVFSDIRLPTDGELHIFSPGAVQRDGACARDCMYVGAYDVPHSHKLTTPMMTGEVVDLHYYQPMDPEQGVFPVLVIHSVMQGVDGEMQVSKSRRRRRLLQDGKHSPGTQFDLGLLQQTSDATAPCTESIACAPEWEETARGVVSIYAINTRIRALGLCTGSIVNAPLGKIYLMTADHCFTDKSEISDFEFWMLLFNYYTACGNNTSPPVTQVIQGTKLLFYDSAADVLLLDLPSAIPDRFKPFYVGFDAQPDTVPVNAVGIHHPHGNAKKISFVNGSISTNFTPVIFPPGEVQPTPRTHFQVIWTQGSTQGGSSGSPLIDVATKRVVGVLTGGVSSCNNRGSPDYFGRISRAWDRGLKRFLSNQPDTSQVALNPQLEADLQLLNENLARQNYSIVTNFLNGESKPPTGPVVNFYPIVNTLYNLTAKCNVTIYLTVPPEKDETMQLDFTIVSLPGNAINLTKYISIDPMRIYYTAANWSTEVVLLINGEMLNGTEAGRLLRYDLQSIMTSLKYPRNTQVSYMKGIIEEKRVKWSDYAPIMVDKLPYYIKAKLGAPISSPSGKALFQWWANETRLVDFYICALSFGKNDLGERQRIGATVSIYLNGTFVWTLSHDPLALDPNCIHIVDAQVFAGSTYHLVASDDNDFNALLPAWGIREAYMGPGNTLAEVIKGSYTHTDALQGYNALAPTASANLTLALALAASGPAQVPSNSVNQALSDASISGASTPSAASQGSVAAPPSAGGYAVTAVKHDTSGFTDISGPQPTDMYGEFPDAPGPAAAGFQAATPGDPGAGSNDRAPTPALPPKHTTLFGSVMDRLVVSSPGSTPASSGADYTGQEQETSVPLNRGAVGGSASAAPVNTAGGGR